MKKVIGILAHVDAGKTTFSEQILYKTNVIRSLGRVDHQNSYMDDDEIEKSRGITIFSQQAEFNYNDNTYYLIDTPGHIDFSPEAERAISVLDYSIIMISAASGVAPHTKTVYNLSEKYNIGSFVFINKTDLETADIEEIFAQIKRELNPNAVFIKDIENIYQALGEFLAERDEEVLELYLENKLDNNKIKEKISLMIKNRQCLPVMSGSALKDIGIDEFLKVFDMLSYTEYDENEAFIGKVFKIRHDESGNRITFIKALSGDIKVKAELSYENYAEKVNEIRFYNSSKYISKNSAQAGDIFAVTGLKTALCGDFIYLDKANGATKKDFQLNSVLTAGITIKDSTPITKCLEAVRILEEEEPMLQAEFNNDTKEITIKVMGKIQLEVLKQLMLNRFNIAIELEKPKVQYRETIAGVVMGYGHYEPLRHYAEVAIRLEPNKGKGIEFSSECSIERLAQNYQNLVETHIFEREHKGVLTGSPLTDIKFILTDGRAHLKHTEGGDFRQATYRGIRQGLEKAENVLLEPFYSFEITALKENLGKIMTDIQKMRGSFEPAEQNGDIITIKGRGPVETFMDYNEEILAYTKGQGSVSLVFDGYDKCEVAEEVIEKIGYDKGADKENTSASVFCKKGAGYTVNWDEAEGLMHTLKN